MRLLFALALLALFAVGPSCKRGDGGGDGGTTAAAPSSGPPDPRLLDLEGHLKYNAAWGSDPIARRVADQVHDALRDRWTASHDVAVAVSIVPSRPRRVVIVAQVKSLREEKGRARDAMIEGVREAIAPGLAPDDEVALGIRGRHGYEVTATGTAAAKWTMTAAKPAPTAALVSALATPPAPPVATRARTGEPLRLGDLEWQVVSVQDKGKTPKPVGKNVRAPTTTGRFLVLHCRVTNHAKLVRRLDHPPKLRDAAGREYDAHPEQDALIPFGSPSASWQELGAGTPVEFWAAYEVPADAAGLSVVLPGPYAAWTSGVVELGL